MRKTDKVFRFGGEEFVVLARNTVIEDAAVIAEQLRAQIELELRDPEGSLTASFGLAQLAPDEKMEDWLIAPTKQFTKPNNWGEIVL